MVNHEMTPLGARDQGHTNLLRDIESHAGYPRAGQQYRYAHQCDFDYHLRGKPARGVKQFALALYIV